MSLLRNREARFSNLLPKVGGFLLIASLTLFAMLTALGFTRTLFVPTAELYISLPHSRSISSGTAVMLRGFRIGQVRSLELDTQGRVDARIAIEARYLPWLGSDSFARRGRDNLLGDTYLEIEPRQNGSPLLAGATVAFVDGGEMDDLVTEAKAKVFPLLDHTNTLVSQLADPAGPWQSTLLSLQKTTERLNSTLDAIDRTLAQTQALSQDSRQILKKDFQPLLTDSHQLVEELRQTSSSFRELAAGMQTTLPELSLKIGRNLDALQLLTPELAQTTRNGDGLIQSVQESVDGLRQSWPVEGLMPAPEPMLLPQNSHE
ncbi:MAG: MlaD family protein [Pseudomonadota bacterium]